MIYEINKRLVLMKLFLFCLLLLFLHLSFSNETHKVVYLEIDNDMENSEDKSLFGGLIIEEQIEMPALKFKQSAKKAPDPELKLNAGFREMIIELKRDNAFNENWLLNEK